MIIRCSSLFDCTRTGIVGNYNINSLPIHKTNGISVKNQQQWYFARNQQRNFETLLQLISLRAQPTVLCDPLQQDHRWVFDFEVDTMAVYSKHGQDTDLEMLLADCEGTPMIVGLNEQNVTSAAIVTNGADQNIWFEILNKQS